MAPPTSTVKPKKADPSRPSKAPKKKKTHTHAGVAKVAPKSFQQKKTPRQLAVEREKLLATLPALNTIVPGGGVAAGVGTSGKKKGIKGKAGGPGKKGKVFIGDHDTARLKRIVETVSSGVEGEVQSKLEKARKLEAIREARREEEEQKMANRKGKLDEAKEKARRKRRKSGGGGEAEEKEEVKEKKGSGRKKVAFA